MYIYTPADVFFAYMWHVWNYERMCEIFGQHWGNIISARWVDLVNRYGYTGAVGVLYESLTPEDRGKLWDAAAKYYSEPVFEQDDDHGRD